MSLRKSKVLLTKRIERKKKWIDDNPEKAESLRKERIKKYLKSLRGSDELSVGSDIALFTKKLE